MSEFSLEEDGYFISDTQLDPDDPFQVLEDKKSKKIVKLPEYSDISDDDFDIPSSQKRPTPRYG